VIGIVVTILIAEVLGSVGLFERASLLIASVAVAVAAGVLRRRPAPVRIVDEPAYAVPSSRASTGVALVVVALSLSRALKASLDALHAGMGSYDTLWYHLPFAARFVQDNSLTHLQYVGNGPTSFYPANGELVHAIGMLLFHGDFLSPVINIGWLALALLAGWCVGRPYGVGPATLIATCVVTFLPVLGGAQAGSAGTDVAVIALLVSAVAVLVNARGSVSAIAVAAIAAGLAVGTKLDAWAPVVLLGLMAVGAARGRRVDAALRWIVGVAIGSGFWYVRNLVVVGNPFPWFGRFVSLPTTTAPKDCGTTSVGHFIGSRGVWSSQLLPQLPSALGARWWLVVGLAAAGIAGGLLSSRPLARGLSAVALVAAGAYVVTPATAGGHDASCFGFNTRFATPALALGLLLVPIAVSSMRWGLPLSVAALTGALLLTMHPSHDAVPLVGAFVLVGCAASVAIGTLPRPVVLGGIACLAMLAVLLGRHEENVYAAGRYASSTFSDPIAPIVARLGGVRHARIAVAGISESYPLYGADLSNRVDYPVRRAAARFRTYATCRSWLSALRKGGYEYVVTAHEGRADSVTARWTRRDPGARALLTAKPGSRHRGAHWTWELFKLDRHRSVSPAAACRAHA
jgi:hypothetical protein